MKSLSRYIQEKLIIKKNKSSNNYKYFPESTEELEKIIYKRIKDEGKEVDLNDIDVSNIIDMSSLFEGTDFNGDISNWNVSNVIDMRSMFYNCESFNQDISNWDVSKVVDMSWMFYWCKTFNQDISNWNVSNVIGYEEMFEFCPIEKKYKPKFK